MVWTPLLVGKWLQKHEATNDPLPLRAPGDVKLLGSQVHFNVGNKVQLTGRRVEYLMASPGRVKVTVYDEYACSYFAAKNRSPLSDTRRRSRALRGLQSCLCSNDLTRGIDEFNESISPSSCRRPLVHYVSSGRPFIAHSSILLFSHSFFVVSLCKFRPNACRWTWVWAVRVIHFSCWRPIYWHYIKVVHFC